MRASGPAQIHALYPSPTSLFESLNGVDLCFVGTMKRINSSQHERAFSEKTHPPLFESNEPNLDANPTMTISDAVESKSTTSKILNPAADEFVPFRNTINMEKDENKQLDVVLDPNAKVFVPKRLENNAPESESSASVGLSMDSRGSVPKPRGQNQSLSSVTLSPHANEFIPNEANQGHLLTTVEPDQGADEYITTDAIQNHNLSSVTLNADADEFIPGKPIFFRASNKTSREKRVNLADYGVVTEQLLKMAMNEGQALSEGNTSDNKGSLRKELDPNAAEFVPSSTLNDSVQRRAWSLVTFDPIAEEFVPRKPFSVTEHAQTHSGVQEPLTEHDHRGDANGIKERELFRRNKKELEINLRRAMASKKDRLTAIEWYRHGELGNTGTMDQKGKADAAQSNISAWQSGETPANVWDDSEEFKMEVRSEPVSNSNSFTIPEDVGNHIVPQVERWSSTEELNDQEEELRRGSWGWRLEATEDNRTSGSQKHDATGKHDVSSALLRMTSRIASNDWDRSERGQASFASAAHEKVDHSGYAAWGKSKAQKGRCWESLREVSPIERWKDYEASIWQKKADSSGRMLSDGGNYGKWNFDERRACKSGSVVKLQSSSSQSNKKYSRCGYSFFQQKQAVAKKSKTKKEEAGNMEYARFACRGKEQNTSTFGACSSFASIKVDTWDVTKDETNDKAKWNKYVDAAGWNGNDETWATCSAVSKTKVEKTDEEYRTGIEKAPAAVQEKKNKAEKKQEVTNAFSDKSEETSLRDGWTESKEDKKRWTKSTRSKRKMQKGSKDGRASGANEASRAATGGRDTKTGVWNDNEWDIVDGTTELNDGAKWELWCGSGRGDSGSQWGAAVEKGHGSGEKWEMSANARVYRETDVDLRDGRTESKQREIKWKGRGSATGQGQIAKRAYDIEVKKKDNDTCPAGEARGETKGGWHAVSEGGEKWDVADGGTKGSTRKRRGSAMDEDGSVRKWEMSACGKEGHQGVSERVGQERQATSQYGRLVLGDCERRAAWDIIEQQNEWDGDVVADADGEQDRDKRHAQHGGGGDAEVEREVDCNGRGEWPRYWLDESGDVSGAGRRRGERVRQTAAGSRWREKRRQAALRAELRDQRRERAVQREIRANWLREKRGDTAWAKAVAESGAKRPQSAGNVRPCRGRMGFC